MIDPDQAIGAALNGLALPGYGWFFGAVTMLGEAYLWLMLLAMALLTEKWRKVAALLIVVLLFSMVVNEDIKGIVHRVRPDNVLVPGYFSTYSYSFPSGHTQTAFVIATALAFFIQKRYNAVTFMLAAAVGMSRMYLGYHYFTDVLGGAAAGITIGLLAIYGMQSFGQLREGMSVSPGVEARRTTTRVIAIKYAVIALALGFLAALAARLVSLYMISLAAVILTYVFVLLLPVLPLYDLSQALYRSR